MTRAEVVAARKASPAVVVDGRTYHHSDLPVLIKCRDETQATLDRYPNGGGAAKRHLEAFVRNASAGIAAIEADMAGWSQ